MALAELLQPRGDVVHTAAERAARPACHNSANTMQERYAYLFWLAQQKHLPFDQIAAFPPRAMRLSAQHIMLV